MKKNLNIKKRKIFILFVLLISWLILTIIYAYSTSVLTTVVKTNLEQAKISVISKTPDGMTFVNTELGELLKGKKLRGTFIANENYLGQILIRFYNFNRINPDSVIFRIKEEGQADWYYINTYKTDQFQPNMYFTFGFPIIDNSKNKTFYFEVESLNGKKDHAIGLSLVKPLGAALYQYPKKVLLSDPNILYRFIIDNKIKKVEINLGTFISLGIYINFITLSLLLVYFSLDYVFKIKHLKLPKVNSFNILVSGLVLLVISAIILYIKMTELSFLLSTLAYFVLTIGVILAVIESKKR